MCVYFVFSSRILQGKSSIVISKFFSMATKENLGSVTFCESFYIQPGVYFILTNNIPRYKAWTVDPTSSESIEKVKDVITSEELGKPVSSSIL
jgi:hypothetical protein